MLVSALLSTLALPGWQGSSIEYAHLQLKTPSSSSCTQVTEGQHYQRLEAKRWRERAAAEQWQQRAVPSTSSLRCRCPP